MRASSTRRKILFLKVGIAAAAFAVVVGGLALLLPRLRERHLARHFEDMVAIERPLYRIYTERADPNGPIASEEIDRFLVSLYAEWGAAERLDLVSPGGPGFPIVVLLLGHESRLRDYHGARYRGTDIRYNAGMYEPVAGTIALVSPTLAGDDELRRGLYHEATHMVLDRLVAGSDPEWSWWLNEGLATYLEASRFHADGEFVLGAPSGRYLRWAAATPDATIREVLGYDSDSFRGRGNTRSYAMSSLLVAFLLEGAAFEYRDAFWRYVAVERAAGPVADDALERTLGVRLESLDDAFRAFVRERLAAQ